MTRKTMRLLAPSSPLNKDEGARSMAGVPRPCSLARPRRRPSSPSTCTATSYPAPMTAETSVPGYSSPFDHPHLLSAVVISGGGRDAGQLADLVGGELDVVGRRVLLDAGRPLGPRDR